MIKKLLFFVAASTLIIAPYAHSFDFSGLTNNKVDTMQVNKPATVKSDEDITKAVKEAFKTDPVLSKVASKVDVKTENGVVTISGTVDSAQVKSDVGAKVRDVAGTDSVVNDITVK